MNDQPKLCADSKHPMPGTDSDKPTGDTQGSSPDVEDPSQSVLERTSWRLPAAAARATAVGKADLPAEARRRTITSLFVLTLLSAVDGSLVVLAATGQLESLGDAVLIGVLSIAGVGSWLAAHELFGGRRPTRSDWFVLGLLGIVTAVAAVAAVWLGATLGDALSLHVLPKAAGIVLFLIAAEVAGIRLPRTAGLPMPVAAIAVAGAVEVGVQWLA